jgi:hypothetical protein
MNKLSATLLAAAALLFSAGASPASTKKPVKCKKGDKHCKAKPAKKPAKKPATREEGYQATLEKVRDAAFALEGLRHIDQPTTDFTYSQFKELVGGLQGEKEKVKRVITRCRKLVATQKFRHLITIRDDEAMRFADKLKVREALAVENGWIDE